MPALSWNEIRQRAIQLSVNWKGITDERAEAQTFWNEFFDVFGIRRRTVASFEEPVKSLKNSYHRIDLFWKGRLLAEHKSAGENLGKAESQAFQYIQELAADNRHDEIPRYVILSDFERIVLYDLEPEEGDSARVAFPLSELHTHIKDFAFFIGQKIHKFGEESEANLRATAIMAGLHDAVAEGMYDTKALERLLVRLLFCLFADDTGIFEPGQFELFIQNRTREDGADLGPQLNALFDVLNTPVNKRARYLDEDLSAFPYVNGELFNERLPTAGFTGIMRNHILVASRFDWSRISPAIFGSLFQGIMEDKERRQIGAHYTSERDILKLIRPLFLDQLRAELERIRADRSSRRTARLHEFQSRLAKLRFLDPACGCGNFLVIAYRELRRLEHDVLRLIYYKGFPSSLFASDEYAKLSQVDVGQFYGIEIGDWPARIAETALWLTDHQMNTELSETTGNLFQRIPLRASPHIKCANALRFDWNELLPAQECSYILGNPPFVGAKEKTKSQRDDLDFIWHGVNSHRILDYVTAWYRKACEYIGNLTIRAAFVSTNSITQGEQVSILWNELFGRGVSIQFAHRTFSWTSEASGKAHVHCVIIGFGKERFSPVRLFEYSNPDAVPAERLVTSINPYLVEGSDIVVSTRSKPLCDMAPVLMKGSEATDNGFLIISQEEKDQLQLEYPEISKFLRMYMGGSEYINGTPRWCFWLLGMPLQQARSHPAIKTRIGKVYDFRFASSKKRTRELAKMPHVFGEIRQPKTTYLLIPKVSSEKRYYIPMGFLPADVIANGSSLILPSASLFHFGILTSGMHMAWMRHVCGRLESRYQYSVSIVYNNFPWPVDATEVQVKKVEECARLVLEARKELLSEPGATMADLYDPLFFPVPLYKAHRALDRAVDRCYRRAAFHSEREQVEFLFELYEQMTSPLAPTAPRKKVRKKR